MRAIAAALGRAPSTLSREVTRNGGRSRYRAASAEQAAWVRASKPKPCKLGVNQQLREAVVEGLELQWSRQQIAGWLPTRSTSENDQPRLHAAAPYGRHGAYRLRRCRGRLRALRSLSRPPALLGEEPEAPRKV